MCERPCQNGQPLEELCDGTNGCDCGQPRPEIVVKCTIAERQVTFDPDAVGTFRVKAAMLSDAVRTMHVRKAAFGLQVAVVETLSEELSVLNEMLDIIDPEYTIVDDKEEPK